MTAIAVFERGPAVQRPSVSAGAVAKLWGLARDPDRRRIGESATDASGPSVPAADAGVGRRRRRGRDDGARLRVALAQLAEQDPLIDVRQDDDRAGDLRLALRRGAEGGDPGDAGGRLRHRRHVPRDDADLRRAADRHRRGRRAPPRGVESVQSPRSGCASSRRRTARAIDFRLEVDHTRSPAVRLQDGSSSFVGAHGRVRARRVAGGPLRLAGHRLRRDDDQVAATASPTALRRGAGR